MLEKRTNAEESGKNEQVQAEHRSSHEDHGQTDTPQNDAHTAGKSGTINYNCTYTFSFFLESTRLRILSACAPLISSVSRSKNLSLLLIPMPTYAAFLGSSHSS